MKKIVIRWLVESGTNEYYDVIQESVRFMYYQFKPADLLVCHSGLNDWQFSRMRDIGADICAVDPDHLIRLFPDQYEVFINAPIIFNDTEIFREFMAEDCPIVSPKAFGLPPGLELPKTAILPSLKSQRHFKFQYKSIGNKKISSENNFPQWWVAAMRDGIYFEEIKDTPEHLGWKFYLAYRWKKRLHDLTK